MLSHNPAMEDFIKEIVKDNTLTVLSRLYLSNSNETVALAIGYIDSNNKYTYSLTTYNTAYRKYSPGKVFLSDLINSVFDNGYECFDMGRSSEPYKNWLTDKQSILFSIKTNNNPKYYKVYRFINKVLDLVFY